MKTMLKMIPKWSNDPLTTMKQLCETHRNILSKILQSFRSCLALSWGNAFVLLPVFRNLWGVPAWTDLGLPCGTLGPMFLTVWKIVGANVLRISKIPEQQMAPTTPSKKTSIIKKHFNDFIRVCFLLPINNKQIFVFLQQWLCIIGFCCFLCDKVCLLGSFSFLTVLLNPCFWIFCICAAVYRVHSLISLYLY